MTWPATRFNTYSAGGIVPSADLNALQDAVRARQHDQLTDCVHFSGGVFYGTAPTFAAGGCYALQSGASSDWYAPIRLPVGSRIVSLCAVYLSATTACALYLNRAPDGTGTEVTVSGAAANVPTSAAWSSSTISPGHTVLSGNRYYLRFSLPTGARFQGVDVLFDKVA